MIIEAVGLRKTFTLRRGRHTITVQAVNNAGIAVGEGEVFGLLGPNGAGKTTIVRMLATLTAPDAGSARVAGYDLREQPQMVRSRIGYVSQAGGVDDGLTVAENLLMQARICRASPGQARDLLIRSGLQALAGRMARTLSGGERRRLALALGLVHRPPLLFLDEPTLALDPHGRAQLWQEIRTLRAEGTSVLLTTHYMDEADALCDRLAIIDHGQIIASGTPGELKDGGSLDDAFLKLTGRTLREGTTHAA